MSSLVDPAAAVREGEALDIDALARFVARELPTLAGQPIVVEQFPRGHSNLTYLLRIGDREVVLRRPPFGAKIATAHDMSREFRLLSGLRGHYLHVPEALAYCDDPAVLGAPFYLMERLRGLIVRKRFPAGLGLDERGVAEVFEAFVDNFVAIHAVDWRSAGLSELYRGEGYVARQVGGWARRYQRAQTDDIAACDEVARWLAANLPTESAPTLIHNDYKHDNLVLDVADPRRVIGVLDWEMATIGDPLMDLGTTLGYWIEANDPPAVQAFAFCPTNAPGAPSRRGLVDMYQRKSGREVTSPVFYFAYGLFKLAVVAQQIYQRYKLGHTKDPRFARFIFGVQMLSQMAADAISAGEI